MHASERWIVAVAVAAAAAAGIVLFGGPSGAGAAAEGIQVVVPATRVCVNEIGAIELGVRWSGSGPRRFRVRLYDPHGEIVLARSGLATRRWKQWAYRPRLGGTYRAVYTLPAGSRRFRTNALGCG
jgi:hypothetical protein